MTDTLPAMIDRARSCLANARSSAELLGAMAAAKAALHYAKLKDATAEAHADCLRIIAFAELKLADEIDAAQARGEVATDGRPKTVQASDSFPATHDDLAIDRRRVHEWRRLRDAGGAIVVERAIAKAIKEGRAPGHVDIRREMNGHHRTHFTAENEWYTPAKYIEVARACMGGIDLDPATAPAAQRIIRAARYYTIDDDGLKRQWRGRIWLNPPYAQPGIVHFVDKLLAEVNAGRATQAIMLTHNYTDTAWFHAAAKQCSALCFTRGRIGFVNASGETAAPTQGQAFFYFGPGIDRFRDSFNDVGFIR